MPIILQDRTFDSDGSIAYDVDGLDIVYGARGETIIVNGAISPVAKVPPGLVRLRLLNGANAMNFDLRFSDQRTFHVVASDAGFLSAPVPLTQLTISPAERFEILVDFADRKPVMLETGPDKEMGAFGNVAADGSADYLPVLRFEPTAATSPVTALPSRLVEPPAADPTLAVRRRQFVLNSGICGGRQQGGTHANIVTLIGINGKTHDLARIDVETKLGTTEIWRSSRWEWRIRFTLTARPSACCRSRERRLRPISWDGRMWFLLRIRPKILVAFNRPATREHPFMYHCHILEHEDAGLMGQYVCI